MVSWIYDTEKSYILVRSTVPTESTWFKSEKETGLMFKKEMEKGLRVRLAQQGVTGVGLSGGGLSGSQNQSPPGNRLEAPISLSCLRPLA